MKRRKLDLNDYRMGCLQSVRNAQEQLGCEVTVPGDPTDLCASDALILTGVGSFGVAVNTMEQLSLSCFVLLTVWGSIKSVDESSTDGLVRQSKPLAGSNREIGAAVEIEVDELVEALSPQSLPDRRIKQKGVQKQFPFDRAEYQQRTTDPAELTRFVTTVRGGEKDLWDGIKRPGESELVNFSVGPCSPFWRNCYDFGAAAAKGDLVALCPGSGLSPARESALLGMKLASAVPAGALVDEQDSALSGL